MCHFTNKILFLLWYLVPDLVCLVKQISLPKMITHISLRLLVAHLFFPFCLFFSPKITYHHQHYHYQIDPIDLLFPSKDQNTTTWPAATSLLLPISLAPFSFAFFYFPFCPTSLLYPTCDDLWLTKTKQTNKKLIYVEEERCRC